MNAIFRRILVPSIAGSTPTFPNLRRSKCGDSSIPASSEVHLNQQIGRELSFSHAYLGIATHFARPTVAMFGAAGFFLRQAADERRHAAVLIAHLNQRGGCVRFGAMQELPEAAGSAFEDVEWRPTMEQALQLAVELEQQNLQSLTEVLEEAERAKDAITEEFLSGDFLMHQVADIAAFEILLTQLRMLGSDDGLGAFLMDQMLAKKWPYENGDMQPILVQGS